jgi:hypothetical protein
MSSTAINKIEAFKAHAFFPLLPMLHARPSNFPKPAPSADADTGSYSSLASVHLAPPAPRLKPGRIRAFIPGEVERMLDDAENSSFREPSLGIYARSVAGALRIGARRARLAEIAGSNFFESERGNHSNDPGGPRARSMGSLMIGWLGPLLA